MKNKIKLILFVLILVGCFNKKEAKINIGKGKGYLKEHLSAEERAELNDIIKNGNIEQFKEFLGKHEDILKNYPIIVKIIKHAKNKEYVIEFIEAIKCFMNKGWYSKDTKRKVLTIKGKMKLKDAEKEVTPLMAMAYYLPEIIAKNLKLITENGLIDINEKNVDDETALMFATMNEEKDYVFEAVSELIDAGADIQIKDKKGITVQYWTVKNRHKEVGALLFKVQIIDENLALLQAAQQGDKEKVELLLAKGARIDEKTEHGNTAFIVAALQGDKELVGLLLNSGASIYEKNKAGFSALLLATQNGHKETVELLLDRGANIDEKNIDGLTALILAAANGHKEIVELLLDKGANVNEKSRDGWTALILAAADGYKEIVELLLDRGANVNEESRDGWTALIVAAEDGYKEIVELLLDRGANVNEKSKDGWTALIVAAEDGHKEIVELLLDRGANVNEKSKDGWTALLLATQNGRKKIVELLLNKGANVNEKSRDGWTALILATADGHKEIAKLLLDRGAKIDEKTEQGATALIIAAQQGHKEIVELLLARGAKIDEKTTNGFTALIAAAERGHTEIAKELLKAGADMNIKMENGLAALSLASNMQIACCLINAGAKEEQVNLDKFINLTEEESIINPKIKHHSISIDMLHKYCVYILERESVKKQIEIGSIIHSCLIKEKFGELVYDIISNMKKEKDEIMLDVTLLRIIDDYLWYVNKGNAKMLMARSFKNKEVAAINIIDISTLQQILLMTKSSKQEIIESLVELKDRWKKDGREIRELKEMKDEDIIIELYKK